MDNTVLDFIYDFDSFGIRENRYFIDNDINVENFTILTSIEMNFYQVWCLFGTIPVVYDDKHGNRVYEWRIQGPKSDFCIRNKKKETQLLKIREWNLCTNLVDQMCIQNFLEHLFEAIKCYDKYYKCIEKNDFDSEDSYIHDILQKIKIELVHYRDLIRQL